VVAFAQPDPKVLIRRSVENYERDWHAATHWGYTQTDVTRADGTNEVDVSEVFPLEGTPYERLIRKGGRALSSDEQRKEDEKYRKAVRQRQAETPAERAGRIDKYEQQRAFIREIPAAYNFTLVGEDTAGNRPAWVLRMIPRPGFEPATAHAGMLKHIEGTLWIDKEELRWAKAEAHIVDTVSIGWILARIDPGAHVAMNWDRVAEGLWMPNRIDINGTARVLLVHSKKVDEEVTFSGFHPGMAGPTRAESIGKPPPAGSAAFH
jgi:hypothetical protein